jgi:hypothetical protein
VGGRTTVLKEKEVGLALLAIGVGPLLMRPIIILRGFGGSGVKMITPGFFPSSAYDWNPPNSGNPNA